MDMRWSLGISLPLYLCTIFTPNIYIHMYIVHSLVVDIRPLHTIYHLQHKRLEIMNRILPKKKKRSQKSGLRSNTYRFVVVPYAGHIPKYSNPYIHTYLRPFMNMDICVKMSFSYGKWSSCLSNTFYYISLAELKCSCMTRVNCFFIYENQ